MSITEIVLNQFDMSKMTALATAFPMDSYKKLPIVTKFDADTVIKAIIAVLAKSGPGSLAALVYWYATRGYKSLSRKEYQGNPLIEDMKKAHIDFQLNFGGIKPGAIVTVLSPVVVAINGMMGPQRVPVIPGLPACLHIMGVANCVPKALEPLYLDFVKAMGLQLNLSAERLNANLKFAGIGFANSFGAVVDGIEIKVSGVKIGSV